MEVVEETPPAAASSPAAAPATNQSPDAGKSRHDLIAECQGLVRNLAWQIHSRLAKSADLDDLISYGQVGLAEAARDFDVQRGGKFSTFAYYRIRGAIYDGLSKMSWFSRAQYRRIRYEQRANELLDTERDAPATGSGDDLVDDVRWLKRLATGLGMAYLCSGVSGDDESQETQIADDGTPDPQDIVMGSEIASMLRQLVDQLPADAGNLIRATYFEGLTLQAAGERIGVSKAWASRLHARTLEKLARALRQRGCGDDE